MLDRSTIDKVFDTANIVEVIQDFVQLKKFGANYKGLCPFHQEKTPSFMVSPVKGIFKCFGCSKAGNAVTFVMEHESLGYVDAIKFLARKYHIEIIEKDQSAEEIQEKNQRESLMIVNAYAQEFFSNYLHREEKGRAIGLSYFKERGINPSMIERFQLGYCPDEQNSFTQAALKNGYQKEFLVKTGLTIERDQWLGDRFRGRIIFPIHNISGRVIGFGGRTLSAEKKVAKYLNSPESEVYYKSQVLYGLYQAKRAIVQNDKCYLVEGYTDVISMHRAGIENVVASSGTALTADQIRLIRRFTENITVLYDGDEAGLKASLRGIDLILEEEMNVRVVLFPDGEDPDSYSRSHSSSELFEYLKEKEQDFILFKTNLIKEEAAKDPIAKGNLIRDILNSISLIPNSIKRQVFVKECSQRLEISEDILYTEISKLLRARSYQNKGLTQPEYDKPKPQVSPLQIKIEKNLTPHFEQEVIRLMIKYGEEKIQIYEDGVETEYTVAQFLVERIDAEESLKLRTPFLRSIFDLIADSIKKKLPINQKDLIMYPDPQISKLVADIISKDYLLSSMWSKKETYVETEAEKLNELVPETVYALKYHRVQVLLKEWNEKLESIKNEDEQMEALMVIKSLSEMNQLLSKKLGDRAIV